MQPEAHTSTAFSRHKALSSTRVAIIDDDSDLSTVLEQRLQRLGYEVATYDRADLALMELKNADPPDVIVLDLIMPGMSGWQFRIEQKQSARLRDVCVIALSADGSPYAKAIDADAYVGKPVDFNELEAVIGRVLLARDRKRLLTASVELERIRALGTLVASVAHEINNPLTYMVGYLDLARSEARELENLGGAGAKLAAALSGDLAEVADGVHRIESVVNLLSTFSSAEKPNTGNVDVLGAVQAAARIVRPQLMRKAEFVEDLVPVPHVVGNEARLAQVVLNLLVNAGQAVEASTGECNRIRLATRYVSGRVEIIVEDTGAGIEPRLLELIFEPFVTTKPAGMGTGLGLSISRDIVADMGGTLTVQSVVGQGATFTVALPIPSSLETNAEPH